MQNFIILFFNAYYGRHRPKPYQAADMENIHTNSWTFHPSRRLRVFVWWDYQVVPAWNIFGPRRPFRVHCRGIQTHLRYFSSPFDKHNLVFRKEHNRQFELFSVPISRAKGETGDSGSWRRAVGKVPRARPWRRQTRVFRVQRAPKKIPKKLAKSMHLFFGLTVFPKRNVSATVQHSQAALGAYRPRDP